MNSYFSKPNETKRRLRASFFVYRRQQPIDAPVRMSNMQLNIRIDRAKRATVRRMLSGTGVKTIDELRLHLNAAREFLAERDDMLESIAQLQAQVEELKPKSVIEVINPNGEREPGRMGRPSLYSQEVVNAIVQSIREGLSQDDAAYLAGITPSTLYEWLRDKPDFQQEVRKAHAIFKRDQITLIRAKGVRVSKTKKDENGNPAVYGSDIPNRWIMERKYPSEYGQGVLIRVTSEEAAILKHQQLTANEAWEIITTQISLAVTNKQDWRAMMSSINGNLESQTAVAALPSLIINLGEDNEANEGSQ